MENKGGGHEVVGHKGRGNKGGGHEGVGHKGRGNKGGGHEGVGHKGGNFLKGCTRDRIT